jgi:hypothetical protein
MVLRLGRDLKGPDETEGFWSHVVDCWTMSSRLMSSKFLRSGVESSGRLEEGKEEDLEDLESVRSGGEPGELERDIIPD